MKAAEKKLHFAPYQCFAHFIGQASWEPPRIVKPERGWRFHRRPAHRQAAILVKGRRNVKTMEENREPECGRLPVCVSDRSPVSRGQSGEPGSIQGNCSKVVENSARGPVWPKCHSTASASSHTISIATGAISRPATRMINGTFPFSVFFGR